MAEFNVSHIANPIKLEGVNVTPEGKLETTASVDANINVESLTVTDVTIRDPNHPERKMTFSPDGSLNVTLSSALNKEYDSIDVGRMSKGGVTTAHDSITSTATSNEINCRGYNALLIHVVVSDGTWEVDILNSLNTNGTFVEAFDGEKKLTTDALTSSRSVLLRGIADFIKVRATGSGNCTVKVQPLIV